jgi:hypothetical protein
MLILVGLAFAGMLGVKKYLDTRPVPAEPASSPAVSRQMAVETAPAPMAAPRPQASAASANLPAAPSSDDSGREVLSYIQFLALPENYPVLSQEISWREYRAYRRNLRQAPEAT